MVFPCTMLSCVLGVLTQLLLLPYVICEQASADTLFQYTLHKDNFFDKYSPDLSQPIVFKPSLIGKPGLPSWLRYIQRDPSTGIGYMYGTPSNNNVGQFKLEIIGLNTYTYESARVLLDITVTESTAPPRYLASFFISDKTVEDLLEAGAQDAFLSAVSSTVWPNVELQIHKLQSGKELGLPGPLPTDTNQKEGVAVVVGSTSPFSSDLKEAQGRCTKASESKVLGDDYSTTWCDVIMTELDATTPPQDTTGGQPVFLGGEYNPPPVPVEESSRLLEFVLIVAVPFGVVLLVILILAYVMYGRREGIKARSTRASSLQLTHHIEIRHASRDLRELSNRRDPATSVSGVPGRRANPTTAESVASSSSGGPSPRHRTRGIESGGSSSSTPVINPRVLPPSYRLPPHPGGLQETSFSRDSPSSVRQSPGHPTRVVTSSVPPPPPPFMHRGYGYGGGTIPVGIGEPGASGL